MDALETKGDLARDLADTPSISLGDPDLEAQLGKIAEEYAEAKEAREALTNVRARLITNEKRREFDTVVQGRKFVLVESRWKIERVESRIILTLAQLRPSFRYGALMRERLMVEEIIGPRPRPMVYRDEPPQPPKPLEMPEEIAVRVTIEASQLTKQGEARFPPDGEASAGVFGTAASHLDGTLAVSPIAVFARQGVPEDEPADFYPRSRARYMKDPTADSAPDR
jgi:hypothetical protein